MQNLGSSDNRSISQLLSVVLLQFAQRRRNVALDDETSAKPGTVHQRETGFLQQWPALAKERAVGLDEHRLNRGAGVFGDEGEAALENVDRWAACPGTGDPEWIVESVGFVMG